MAQNRHKQSNAVESSAVRSPLNPSLEASVPRCWCVGTALYQIPAGQMPGHRAPAQPLGGSKATRLTALHTMFFSFLATAFISLVAPFLLGVFFSKLKVSLFLLLQSRSTSITFFLRKKNTQLSLGIAFFTANLTKLGAAALMLSPHHLGEPCQCYLPRLTEIHPGLMGTAKTAP